MKFLRSTLPTTISIKLSIDPNLNNIYGDATQIQQVVMNLCTNASHAMEEKGGTLEIALTNFEIKQKTVVTGNLDPGDYLCLTVSDTGKGMNDETKQRIFEPFFTTKEKGKGTGLGLSSAHGIISKHGGIINVDSKEDLGTRFDIYLPAWINDAEGTEKEVEPELPTGSESILFVDDESDLCDVYGEMLKSQGYRVQTTSSSRDALDRFIKNSCAYDLIVTDYTMPEMNGIELSREIHKYNNNMPVILISGLGELIPDEELKSTGIVARYSKPIEFGTLIRGVKEILDKKFG
ncbi:MAG: response regulator [Deltaproteobacteria bacterium]|nr:response regulator [Deltaproteobacteria bacterium]